MEKSAPLRVGKRPRGRDNVGEKGKESKEEAKEPLVEEGVEQKARLRAKNGASLSEQQREAVELVKAGKSIFLSGSAGTGKTHVIKHLMQVLHEGAVFVTASTGLAASNISGTTLHSFAGIGLGDEPVSKLVERVRANRRAFKNWQTVRVLIIDEISMIAAPLFDKLEELARELRKNSLPFGGVQLLLSGDFLQLPPVEKNGKALFCFQAQSWKKCIQETVELKTVFRQSDDLFVRMLAALRLGRCGPNAQRIFRECLNRVFPTTDGIQPTRLYPLKREVAAENEARLAELTGEEVEYRAQDTGEESFKNLLQRNAPAPDLLTLKVGAQVLLTKNIDAEGGLVNGSRGVVIGFGLPDEEDSADTKAAATETSPEDKRIKEIWKAYLKTQSDTAESSQRIHPQRRWPIVRFTNG